MKVSPQKLTIHCPTQEAYNKVMVLLDINGFLWKNHEKMTKTNWWLKNKEDTHIFIQERYEVSFGDSTQGWPVMEASLFLKHYCDDCKGTGVYVGLFVTEPCETCKLEKS